ncbi:hypothetical protein CPB86DRAFT_820901 [Serendipita vermifera]|nr:hypothetical protein CPB86DRAFT_820901 [Serendipita vermifera]
MSTYFTRSGHQDQPIQSFGPQSQHATTPNIKQQGSSIGSAGPALGVDQCENQRGGEATADGLGVVMTDPTMLGARPKMDMTGRGPMEGRAELEQHRLMEGEDAVHPKNDQYHYEREAVDDQRLGRCLAETKRKPFLTVAAGSNWCSDNETTGAVHFTKSSSNANSKFTSITPKKYKDEPTMHHHLANTINACLEGSTNNPPTYCFNTSTVRSPVAVGSSLKAEIVPDLVISSDYFVDPSARLLASSDGLTC